MGDEIPILPLDARLRFVVLRHTGHGPEHFDLMLAIPGRERLLTWRLAAAPSSGVDLMAARIADHRAVYLTYEGAISENRGEVVRVDSGAARVVEQSARKLRLRLNGVAGCEIQLPL